MLFCFCHICSICKIWITLEENRRISMATNSCGLKKRWQYFLCILIFLFCDSLSRWINNDKHISMVCNIQYKQNLHECSKNLSSLMYTCKKLSACCYVVRSLQEGYVNKNCCSLTHTRALELKNVASLAFPYENLTQKHRRSYQDENT